MGLRGGVKLPPPPAYPEFEVPQHAGIGLKKLLFFITKFY